MAEVPRIGVDVDGSWKNRDRVGKLGNAEFAEVTEQTRDGIVARMAATPSLTFDQAERSIREAANQCGGDRGRAITLGIAQARRRYPG
jgi:hypothetical protein